MSEQAAPEPTMEEILASIRRIISEDDAPPSAEAEADAPAAEAQAAPAPEPEPAPAPEPVVAEAEEDDVLELTERVEPAAETHGDLDVYAKPEPAPKPAPKPAPVFSRAPEETLVSDSSAFAAASSFSQLTATIVMPEPGRTLEDLTRELLKPLLKAWLDEHLPRIVEAKVAEEVERIARTRVR
jgi:cell pole-organizing protein PopZ